MGHVEVVGEDAWAAHCIEKGVPFDRKLGQCLHRRTFHVDNDDPAIIVFSIHLGHHVKKIVIVHAQNRAIKKSVSSVPAPVSHHPAAQATKQSSSDQPRCRRRGRCIVSASRPRRASCSTRWLSSLSHWSGNPRRRVLSRRT